LPGRARGRAPSEDLQRYPGVRGFGISHLAGDGAPRRAALATSGGGTRRTPGPDRAPPGVELRPPRPGAGAPALGLRRPRARAQEVVRGGAPCRDGAGAARRLEEGGGRGRPRARPPPDRPAPARARARRGGGVPARAADRATARVAAPGPPE